MDEHDNRGRRASWAEEQGCDKRSSLVFLSMVPEEREMVRNLGALRKPGVRNVSSVLMSRIRRINPNFTEHDALAAPWLRCSFCGVWGKCCCLNNPIVIPLTDMDGVGCMCENCLLRGQPPHARLYRRILPQVAPEVLQRILDFTFLTCYENGPNGPQAPAHTAWTDWRY